MREMFLGKNNTFLAMIVLNFISERLLDVEKLQLSSRFTIYTLKEKNQFLEKNILRVSQRYFNVIYLLSDQLAALFESSGQNKSVFWNFLFSFSDYFFKFSHQFLKIFYISVYKGNERGYWLALAQENQEGPVSRASILFTTKVIRLRTAYKRFQSTLILYFSPYILRPWL